MDDLEATLASAAATPEALFERTWAPTIFDEALPSGWLGGIRIAAFVLVIVGAVALARHQKGAAGAVPEEHVPAEAVTGAS